MYNYEYDEGQGDAEWPIASHVANPHFFMAVYDCLDSDFNLFSAIVKRRRIFTGRLSKRMVNLGRKLDVMKPIIDQLAMRINATDPQTRQRIWNTVKQEAKSYGLMSLDTAFNDKDLDFEEFNSVGLEKIRTLEAKYECLQLVKIRAWCLLEQIRGGNVVAPQSMQGGARGVTLRAKSNKVLVVGDMPYELVDYLQKYTAYRVWYLPNVSIKSMEMVIMYEPKEEHLHLENIFLFSGKVDIRDERDDPEVLKDFGSLLVAVKVVYGSMPRISVCCGPDLVGGSLEEREKCRELSVQSVDVYPNYSTSCRVEFAAQVAYAISQNIGSYT